ncbi:MFS transporter [Nocardioides bizhenqiangii]|uniref:Lysosomal dipeptide transporter MFSD1 n=1 Tax=Nocardioides bizhenqiangii TaxID=3095076 RepID=A0ABZ0ZVN9_9ACTN|nr:MULTISPECIES: MFS transporter [unclassified Nocardioides]MDZ5622000.1 MFS transporter [Nocardioides sp. HM23]WQQ27323.1 MFS transporter [Nocardioides sp. HM61]
METPRRAWLVWGVALTIYVVVIFHRTSLAVAGLAATERFDLSASQLGAFTMLQLLVYAGMQVPVGLLVDRFGPRTVLTAGVVTISLAQAGFALATSYPEALTARVLVGLGDAMTFICVLRLVSSWFGARQIPLVTQLTGSTGQIGSIAAAVPMTWALSELGWTAAYLVSAALGPVLLAALLVFVRDSPEARHVRGHPMSRRALLASLRASWAQPGTRLGFWVHFTTPFSAHVLVMLWGFPFLVLSEGVSETVAGALLSLIIVAVVASGPVLGWVVGRHPWHRSTVALGTIVAMVAVWTAVLAWPGDAPLWLLVLLVVACGCGGPASMIGFDVGRTSNPPDRMASASGIINVGGFFAAVVAVFAIGGVLDLMTSGSSTEYTPEAFRAAMSVQYLLWGLGALQIWRYRTIVRRTIGRDVVESGSTMVA